MAAAAGNHQVVVVMVPLAAQGHLNQLLHLSRLISAYNIPIHYVGTTTHNRQAKLRLHGWNPNQLSNFHFHDFTIPTFPSPPPKSTAGTKFPAHLLPSFQSASIHLRHPLTQLLLSLSSKVTRVVVIYDSLMASTVEGISDIPNAESYNFHSISAFSMAFSGWEQTGMDLNISEISNDHSTPKDLKIPSLDGCFSQEFLGFLETQFKVPRRYCGHLHNTCRLLEKPYLDILQKRESEIGYWALGPFNPVMGFERKPNNSIIDWLDRQEAKSVIYVSFGTTTTFEEEQIEEIAIGLERSGQKFIWVLRDADKGNVFEGDVRKSELPEGFEKRVAAAEGRGLVVRDWAPQLEILSHRSTAGFMTHCGWNSCMESLTMGVPVAAWPMHSDQPRNSVLMTAVLRVGLLVREWDRREEIVTAATVENVVRNLMASEEGWEMRKRAEELGDAVRRSVDDGGVSRRELDSFIAHITR